MQHHVRSDDELDAGEILDGEVVAESDEPDDQSDEEASEPLHEYVLQNLDLSSAPPILLEELVLKYPAKPQQRSQPESQLQAMKIANRKAITEREKSGVVLVIEALDRADMRADYGDLRGRVRIGSLRVEQWKAERFAVSLELALLLLLMLGLFVKLGIVGHGGSEVQALELYARVSVSQWRESISSGSDTALFSLWLP